MQETWVRSLGWEDPLQEGMATLSSILAWRIPVDRGGGGLRSIGSQRATEWLSTEFLCTVLLEETFVQAQALQRRVPGPRLLTWSADPARPLCRASGVAHIELNAERR